MGNIKDTLYAKYISEREGLEILENEVGFLTYKTVGEECFIANMYVEPDYRNEGRASYLIKELEEVAISAGCKCITGNVYLADNGHDRTIKAVMKIGFKIVRAEAGIILLMKEVNNG